MFNDGDKGRGGPRVDKLYQLLWLHLCGCCHPAVVHLYLVSSRAGTASALPDSPVFPKKLPASKWTLPTFVDSRTFATAGLCTSACPQGLNSERPSGQSCFSQVNCCQQPTGYDWLFIMSNFLADNLLATYVCRSDGALDLCTVDS